MYLKRILKLWQELAWWEKELFLWFGHMVYGKTAILPAMSVQAGSMALMVWLTPGAPILWCLVFILSPVYALIFLMLIKR